MLLQVSINELEDFARRFWTITAGARVFAFHGEMGAGKTTLITALCRFKGVKDDLSSPTFSIINEYYYKEEGSERKIFHMDLYRLNSMEDVIQAGVEDCIYSDHICFVEWPEKAPALFDKDTVHIFIKTLDPLRREVKVDRTNVTYP